MLAAPAISSCFVGLGPGTALEASLTKDAGWHSASLMIILLHPGHTAALWVGLPRSAQSG